MAKNTCQSSIKSNFYGGSAEFGITIRKCAMEKRYSEAAMEMIIKKGLEELGLKRVFWCVNSANARAVRFYDKNGYQRIKVEPPVEGYTEEQVRNYYWYEVV